MPRAPGPRLFFQLFILFVDNNEYIFTRLFHQVFFAGELLTKTVVAEHFLPFGLYSFDLFLIIRGITVELSKLPPVANLCWQVVRVEKVIHTNKPRPVAT